MGHPRLGEMMSRQRLCGDVLLASLNALSAFVFVKFYRSHVIQTKAAESVWLTYRASRLPSGEHYLQNNLNALNGRQQSLIKTISSTVAGTRRAQPSPKLSCSPAQIRQAAA
jgi:hypothetical protein